MLNNRPIPLDHFRLLTLWAIKKKILNNRILNNRILIYTIVEVGTVVTE